MKNLADKLRERKDVPIDTAPHLVVEARAGTGKTTTLVEGLKLLKGGHTDLTPSPQQELIWRSICQSKRLVGNKYVFTGSVCFVAFNKAIADELKQRVPEGCNAMTIHSMGLKALRDRFPSNEGLKLNQFRVRDIVVELQASDLREQRQRVPLAIVIPRPREEQSDLLRATERLVSLCKMNLLKGFTQERVHVSTEEQLTSGDRHYVGGLKTPYDEQLQYLASQYDVDLNDNEREVFDLVPRVLEQCKNVAHDGCVDYDDMIWLPVVLDLDVYRYDLLLGDEVQDWNRCQQQLALKAGRRLILVGDPKQAIYGWAGADGESMGRMQLALENVGTGRDSRGCVTLPLTVTRRCGRAIVEEARKIVPDIEAHESCCDGIVRHNIPLDMMPDEGNWCQTFAQNSYRMMVQPGDMILCRVNAPLVSECFKFIQAGCKATIRGRKIGQGLVSVIRKMKAGSLNDLRTKLLKWFLSERNKENAKRNPNENRSINLHDRYDCLLHFIDGAASVQAVISHIQSIFSDEAGEGILLSSIHKAKGLEAKRVFLLMPEGAGIPHPMARTSEQIKSEYNLLYVAITRARREFCYVT